MTRQPGDEGVLGWPEAGSDQASGETAAAPPEATGAEQFFFRKHMQRRTAVVVMMVDGTRHRGWIEWYDRDVLKLHSFTEANLFLRKDEVAYLYRHADDPEDPFPVPTPPPLPPGRRRRGGGKARKKP
jgi:hypothetical protein